MAVILGAIVSIGVIALLYLKRKRISGKIGYNGIKNKAGLTVLLFNFLYNPEKKRSSLRMFILYQD